MKLNTISEIAKIFYLLQPPFCQSVEDEKNKMISLGIRTRRIEKHINF